MVLVLPDPMLTVASLLQNGWNPSNVDGSEPTWSQAADVKVQRPNRGTTNPGDAIHIYTISQSPGALGIDYNYRTRRDVIAISVSSTVSRDHEGKLCSEIERIVNLNRKNPATLPAGSFGYDRFDLEPWKDLASKTAKRWAHVAQVILLTYAELITTV